MFFRCLGTHAHSSSNISQRFQIIFVSCFVPQIQLLLSCPPLFHLISQGRLKSVNDALQPPTLFPDIWTLQCLLVLKASTNTTTFPFPTTSHYFVGGFCCYWCQAHLRWRPSRPLYLQKSRYALARKTMAHRPRWLLCTCSHHLLLLTLQQSLPGICAYSGRPTQYWRLELFFLINQDLQETREPVPESWVHTEPQLRTNH